jgi:UDP-N-acetylglucosamine 2-epimerase (non-hydrolysing)
MKILTVFGTRPEIIRLSLVMRLLDEHSDHLTVHTGQNYDPNLSDVFLQELGIRPVSHHLGVRASGFAGQAGQILSGVDDLLAREKPDRLLILGDTNSGLAAVVAARRGIPVYHLEAGNRCYDNRVPEEVNRRIIDHSSDVLLPYTERSAENLVREGIRRDRIFVVGNPILEVLEHFQPQVEASSALDRLGLDPKGYFLVTMHRAENVDHPPRLRVLLDALATLAKEFGIPAVVSLHPRTADRIQQSGINVDPKWVRLQQPFGLFDFIRLEQSAAGVVTDSGTVQEEACIFGIPNVTIRDVTERPETTECGSNILAGQHVERLVGGMRLAMATRTPWIAPTEYQKRNVAATVARILLSHRQLTPGY